jgi:hypothetical protein
MLRSAAQRGWPLRGLRITVEDGPELSEQTLDEMLQLRSSFMALKPDVEKSDDRDKFATWMRAPGATVAVARDAAGAIQVFIDMNARRVEREGQSYVVLFGNFVFAARRYRSHPAYAFGNFLNLGTQLLRQRARPRDRVVYLGALYPPTFLMGARTFPSFYAAGEAIVPRDLSGLADEVAPAIFGSSWMPEERLVRMRTIPQDYTPHTPEMASFLARYEQRNPRWRSGYGVLMVAPLSVGNLAGAAGVALRRAALS